MSDNVDTDRSDIVVQYNLYADTYLKLNFS